MVGAIAFGNAWTKTTRRSGTPGSDVTVRTLTEVTWSNQLSLRSAATAPTATPMSAPRPPATKTRTAELMILGSAYPPYRQPVAGPDRDAARKRAGRVVLDGLRVTRPG